jgi:ATP-binding cassette, subfamily B, putative efflux pump
MSEDAKSKKKFEWSDVWPEAKELLWRYRKRMLLGFFLLIISRLSGMVLPASTKFLIDDVIGQHKVEMLKWLALGAGGATVINAAMSFTLTMLLGVAGQRAIADLRRRVQRHVGRLPVSYYENHKSGELISRIMSDAEGIRNLVGTGFVQMVGGVFSALVALAVLLWLNWRLTSLTLVFLALFGVVMVRGFSLIRPIFRERGQINAEVTGRLSESLGGIRVIKAYTAEKREERIFTHGAHRLLRNVAKSMVGVSAITSLSTLIFGLVGIVMSIVGAREVLAERMTVGDIFMFVMFTGLLVRPLVQMSNIGTQFTEAFAGLDRIREVLSEEAESDVSGAIPLPRIDGLIAFEGVTFEYNPEQPVLRHVSFVAPAGTTTALVGSSGAGKSTVISLVMGFRHPKVGRVTVDGHGLREVRMDEYRRQLAVVLQDDFLFDGTIADNIAFGRPGASRADVERAGRLARCEEFVSQFEHGYETVIGERGVKLSGGQRQRVSIARATLADPRLLILDEATSSLDSENEAEIQEGFKRLKQGRTTFVIAHRLSTIRNADQILVMEGGEIVERGTHDELLAAGGRYRELYDKQYNLQMDQFINPGEDFTPEPERAAATPRAAGAEGGLPRD